MLAEGTLSGRVALVTGGGTPVDTPQAAEKLWPTQEIRDALLAKIPLGRFGSADDVRNA